MSSGEGIHGQTPEATHGAMLSVEFREVSVSFGGVKALRGASGSIPRAKMTALVGPNGAGKTTLVNVLTGFTRADSGRIWLQAQEVPAVAPHVVARMGIARTFQDLRLFGHMTVLDNVLAAFPGQHGESVVGLFGRWAAVNRQEVELRERGLELLDFVGLDHKRGVTASDLSYGQQKRLALARVLATGSELLLLDEPAAGLDPDAVRDMGRMLRFLVDSGKTVCLVEHNLELVVEHADWLIGMAYGQVVVQGAPDAALSDAGLVDAYITGGMSDASP